MAKLTTQLDDLMLRILEIIPGAEFDEDAEGQVVINTNLRERGDLLVPMTGAGSSDCEWGRANGWGDCAGDAEVVDGHTYCAVHADAVASQGRPAWLDT